MKLIIGGSSSTGSSLLNQCLGRHHDVLISPETSLFARPQLIRAWDTYKHRILNWGKLKPLRSYGWHRENGVAIPYREWWITADDLGNLIEHREDFSSFIQGLEKVLKDRNQKSIWVEKTPANALNMASLSNVLSNTEYIVMVRHPLEAIASMIHRGYDPLYACGIFLLNSSYALSIDSTKCRVIQYEDFLQDYQSITEKIIAEAGLDPACMDWASSEDNIKIDSWRYAEDELPKAATHDRFQTLPLTLQQQVLCLINCLRIKDDFQIAGSTAKFLNIKALADATGYEFPLINDTSMMDYFKRQLRRDLIKRTALMDPINMFNAPFEIIRP